MLGDWHLASWELGGVCLVCWILTRSYLKVRLGRDGGTLRDRSAEWGHSHMHSALHAGRTNSGPLAERLRPSCRPNPPAGSALAKASPAYKPDSCIGTGLCRHALLPPHTASLFSLALTRLSSCMLIILCLGA